MALERYFAGKINLQKCSRLARIYACFRMIEAQDLLTLLSFSYPLYCWNRPACCHSSHYWLSQFPPSPHMTCSEPEPEPYLKTVDTKFTNEHFPLFVIDIKPQSGFPLFLTRYSSWSCVLISSASSCKSLSIYVLSRLGKPHISEHRRFVCQDGDDDLGGVMPGFWKSCAISDSFHWMEQYAR